MRGPCEPDLCQFFSQFHAVSLQATQCWEREWISMAWCEILSVHSMEDTFILCDFALCHFISITVQHFHRSGPEALQPIGGEGKERPTSSIPDAALSSRFHLPSSNFLLCWLWQEHLSFMWSLRYNMTDSVLPIGQIQRRKKYYSRGTPTKGCNSESVVGHTNISDDKFNC